MFRSSRSFLVVVGAFTVAFLSIISHVNCKPEATDESANNTEIPPDDDPGEEVVMSFSMPGRDGFLSDKQILVNLTGFEICVQEECFMICRAKNLKTAYCDTKNPRLCMCSSETFYSTHLEGSVTPVDREDLLQRNCSVSCNKRMSYARIWTKLDNSRHCICLMHQMTSTGITLCDEFAVADVCKAICQTDAAVCTFNGVCVCRRNWEVFFKLSVPNIRKEVKADLKECSAHCSSYHHDYVGRIYDSRMQITTNDTSPYGFKEKYCLCGEWLDVMQNPKTRDMVNAGFQLCTGLKCKRRCGMDEAICEPNLRRACLCNRENIIIGKHLWSRLPGHGEIKCYEACIINGLDARVLEWNPFMDPAAQKFDPNYRKSVFQYLYDGKFCHCIQVTRDMHQYRPCTDELCQIICGHYEAECDKRTRRACFCNTHQLPLGIGRKADPAEINCDIECRYGLFDGRILDVKWEIQPDKWAVKVSKYCTCIRPVSPAGLSHCDPYQDECPKFCGNPEAYCTREKYCHCGVVPDILTNPMIRLGDGKEHVECEEKCHSWMWPIAEDTDNKPYIYDESYSSCSTTLTCPKVDSSPWKQDKPGALTVTSDALEQTSSDDNQRFCLCAKSVSTMYKPGTRFLMEMAPARIPKDKPPCFKGHTCAIVGNSLHIID